MRRLSCLVLLVCMFSGCSSIPPDWNPVSPKCPSYSGPGTLRGVSADYNWMSIDYNKFYYELANRNCNGTSIEFFSWTGCYDINRGLDPLKGPYRDAVDAARGYKGILFVSICNDNQGSGKYGDNRPRWSSLSGLADEALAFIISVGPKNVIVQPVSETQTSWGKIWEVNAIAKLNAAGFITCYNRGSRPTSPGGGANRNAYHPFKVSDIATDGDIIVTDTGSVLAANTNDVSVFMVIQDGGIYGPSFNDATVGAYAKSVHQAGGRDLLIYGFINVRSADTGAMSAVGNSWK